MCSIVLNTNISTSHWIKPCNDMWRQRKIDMSKITDLKIWLNMYRNISDQFSTRSDQHINCQTPLDWEWSSAVTSFVKKWNENNDTRWERRENIWNNSIPEEDESLICTGQPQIDNSNKGWKWIAIDAPSKPYLSQFNMGFRHSKRCCF